MNIIKTNNIQKILQNQDVGLPTNTNNIQQILSIQIQIQIQNEDMDIICCK